MSRSRQEHRTTTLEYSQPSQVSNLSTYILLPCMLHWTGVSVVTIAKQALAALTSHCANCCSLVKGMIAAVKH